MQEIDWNSRLIGIKGSRGVGKTTFLLAIAKAFTGTERECLYINLNNFYFTQRSLFDFADEFYKKGGKLLLIDQVFKYPEWSIELRQIYDTFPELKIVFTGSSVMRLKEENADLSGKVDVYNLRGFSFREFLMIKTGLEFEAYPLDEILNHHSKLSKRITEQIKPLAYFQDYMHHGYYPFFTEQDNYSENLLKTINLMLEIDVTYLKQIELKYLPKLRSLFYILGAETPGSLNVSKLSANIQTSRATVMNYIKYLKDARLFNLLYSEGEDFPKKPAKIYLHNTNLYYSIDRDYNKQQPLCETFLYNMLHKNHKVNIGTSRNLFLVDKKINIDLKLGSKKSPKIADVYYATDMIENGSGLSIPLWLFGFLY